MNKLFSKIIKHFVFVLFLITLSVKPGLANENFDTYVNVKYKVNENGITSVTNTFTLKNRTSTLQAEKYILSLKGIDPTNIKAYEKGSQLKITKEISDDNLILTIDFYEKVLGIGKTRTFIVTYDDERIANKSGEIWEISIPKLVKTQDFSTYDVQIFIPKKLGDEAYMFPTPESAKEEAGERGYFFNKEQLGERGITAGFGKSQIFNFTLAYHLENTLKKDQVMQIAIPPDTSLQRVYYQNIEPKPLRVEIDGDGNWIAFFNLKSKERKDITAYGAVQIFASPRKLAKPTEQTLSENTKESTYWQTSDPEIKELAKNLKTPKEIYDYVTSYLTYDMSRVRPDVVRMGAKSALATPSKSICMEFTDLFIAISRSAGIPAREINGYAHTDNSEIKPLSLVADVLHAWPEYWSETEQTWIAIDPTWGATSGGDYFSKLDLRHFTFVIHGINAAYPISPGSYKLGNNPQKDVFVTFGNSPPERTSNIQLDHNFSWGLAKKKLNLTFRNLGSTAEYDLVPSIFFDGVWKKSDKIGVLPPFAEYKTSVEVPYGNFGSLAPNQITVKISGESETIATDKVGVIVFQLLIFTLLFLGLLILFLMKFKKMRISILLKLLGKRGT